MSLASPVRMFVIAQLVGAANYETSPPVPTRQVARRRWLRWRLLYIIASLGILPAAGGLIYYAGAGDPAANATSGTAPAAGITADQCMKVTAKDLRVFTEAHGEQAWTRWTTGTRFWADPNASSPSRYRTTLHNGNQGWVTNNPQWVALATDCP
jgi:hypothetical protein